MALEVGTSCGFVTSAPVDAPTTAALTIDGKCFAMIDTTPLEINRITEMGVWLRKGHTSTIPVDVEIGIYTDDGNDDNDTDAQAIASNVLEIINPDGKTESSVPPPVIPN